METMYNTTCMKSKLHHTNNGGVYREDMYECIISTRVGNKTKIEVMEDYVGARTTSVIGSKT